MASTPGFEPGPLLGGECSHHCAIPYSPWWWWWWWWQWRWQCLSFIAKCVKFNISLPPPSGSKKALNESLVFDWRGEIWVARVSEGGNWKGMGIRNRVRTFEACTSWNGLYFEKSLKCNALARFSRLKGETLFSHQQLLWMRHIFTTRLNYASSGRKSACR